MKGEARLTSDEEVVQLSKTISEILESGESTSARLDEPLDAAEKMAIDAYVQIYGDALVEAFDNEAFQKALITTSPDIGWDQTEPKDRATKQGAIN